MAVTISNLRQQHGALREVNAIWLLIITMHNKNL